MNHNQRSPSLERFALDTLSKRLGVSFERKGFMKEIRRRLKATFEPEDFPRFRRIPDSWFSTENKASWDNKLIYSHVRDDWPLIVAVEVEDTSTLTFARLYDYAWFWFELDSDCDFDLALMVTDRYGSQCRFVDLPQAYLTLICKRSQGKEDYDANAIGKILGIQ